MPSLLGGTVTVGSGAASVTVTGTFPASYQAFVEPDWPSGHGVGGKTTGQFVATFAVEAPAGGGSLDWWVWG